MVEDLARRRPGQSRIVTPRDEPDVPEILSGVFEGKTTGTSIAVLIRNQDQRDRDYTNNKDTYRPGHADFTYDAKYGARDYRGGGRSSARETTVRVAAGVVAKKLIASAFGGRVVGYVRQVGDIVADIADPAAVTLDQVERLPDGDPNIVRCPDPERAVEMVALIDQVREARDSIGGVGEIVATGVPAGLGEPGVRQAEGRLGEGAFQPAGRTGGRIRGRLRLCGIAWQREQRSLLRRRARCTAVRPPNRNTHESPRRYAGRHLERDADRAACRREADQQPAAAAGDRHRERRANHHQHQGTSRPLPAPAVRADGRSNGRDRARRPLVAVAGVGPNIRVRCLADGRLVLVACRLCP